MKNIVIVRAIKLFVFISFAALAAPVFVDAIACGGSCSAVPVVDITQSMKKASTAGSSSSVYDNDYSTFLGVGEKEHYGGWVNVVVTYNFSSPADLQNISF